MLATALAFVAAGECYTTGAYYETCYPVRLHDKLRKVIPNNALFTWRAEPAHFFTLHKRQDGRTIVYSHESARFYFAAGSAMLASAVPAGTEILCQYVVDCSENSHAQYLLAFDIFSLGSQSTVGMDVTHRYALLRQEVGPHVGHTSDACIRIQWVGHFECAEQVVGGEGAGFSVPHVIGGAFVLKDGCAGDIDFVSAAQFQLGFSD